MLTGASVGPAAGSVGGRGCRVSGATGATGSTLLLTEYLVFLLDHRKAADLRLAADAFGMGFIAAKGDVYWDALFVFACDFLSAYP